MSSRTLYRLSGIGLLIGSPLLIIEAILVTVFGLTEVTSTTPASSIAIGTFADLLFIIGAMLIALGLPGMYARQAGRTGVLGLIGFTCTFLFIPVQMAIITIFAVVFPFLATHGLLNGGPPPVGMLILFIAGDLLALVGGILFGAAVLRAAVLPRWAGALLTVGGPLYALTGFLRLDPFDLVGLIIFAAGLAWLAVGMLSKQSATVETALPPTGVRA